MYMTRLGEISSRVAKSRLPPVQQLAVEMCRTSTTILFLLARVILDQTDKRRGLLRPPFHVLPALIASALAVPRFKALG
jgi:hypothetical protein